MLCRNLIASCCNLLGLKCRTSNESFSGPELFGWFVINRPSAIIAVEILRFSSRKLILWEQPFLHIICAWWGFRHHNICVFTFHSFSKTSLARVRWWKRRLLQNKKELSTSRPIYVLLAWVLRGLGLAQPLGLCLYLAWLGFFVCVWIGLNWLELA